MGVLWPAKGIRSWELGVCWSCGVTGGWAELRLPRGRTGDKGMDVSGFAQRPLLNAPE